MFVEGGKKADNYVFFGEFDGVKIWHNANIDISEQTAEQKETIRTIQIHDYIEKEPYFKTRLKTKPIYTIDN